MTKAKSKDYRVDGEELWEAWKAKIPRHSNYLSADSGWERLSNKTEAVGRPEGMAATQSRELSNIKVTFLTSDAALITYKATQDATCNGQAAPPAVWASSAYVKRGGKWFAASHQETPAKTN